MCAMLGQLKFVTKHISVQVVRGSKSGAKKHFCGTFSKKYLGLHALLSEIQSFTDIGIYSQILIYPFDERCYRWRHLQPRGTSRLSSLNTFQKIIINVNETGNR